MSYSLLQRALQNTQPFALAPRREYCILSRRLFAVSPPSRLSSQSHRRSRNGPAPVLAFVSSLTRGTPLFGLVPAVLFVAPQEAR